MNENKNKIKLSEQLPVHSSDPGAWNRLAAKLDVLDAEAAYQEKLQGLPLHSPDQGMWATISRRLTHAAYLKLGTRIALSAAAGLLLFITVSRISDYYPVSPEVTQVARHEQPVNTSPAINQENPGKEQLVASRKTIITSKTNSTVNNTEASVSGNPKLVPVEIIPAIVPEENIVTRNTQANLPAEKETEPVAQNTSIPETVVPLNELALVRSQNAPDSLAKNISHPEPVLPLRKSALSPIGLKAAESLKEQVSTPEPRPLKYYSPSEPKTGRKTNHFAIAMDYLPENINNGTNNSLFHNVDLTASYNKEKIRYNTSVGMAYNEEQLSIDMNYDIKSPVTAVGPAGKLDTLSYNVANVESQYMGSEKHQYFTYNIGIGRRLFSIGKFSTWFNAGAGFGVRLNNPDLVSTTEKSIKTQYNARINSINTSKAVYNDVNVNFVTGIDFNYKLFNRLSIVFTPTGRWYFKPVLTKNNQATDELTLGFKTGMKFEF